jgi:DNA invertase Pin-like site-specific DNA recombinase
MFLNLLIGSDMEHLMIIGYARTSTVEQQAGLDAQKRDLKAAGAERCYFEQTSSVGPRKELETAIDFVREGDVLVVTKLDRLARSITHLGELMGRLEEKRVALRILGMGVDTGTPTGRLMVNLFGSIAQFEREVMLERQREGIAKAKAEGKYRGRKPTARALAVQIMEMQQGGATKEAIAAKLGIGVASVYRVLRDARDDIWSQLRDPVTSGVAGQAAAPLKGQIVSEDPMQTRVVQPILAGQRVECTKGYAASHHHPSQPRASERPTCGPATQASIGLANGSPRGPPNPKCGKH